MNDLKTYFEENKYVYLPDFLDKTNCSELVLSLRNGIQKRKTWNDEQCPLSQSIRDNPVFDKLLLDLQPKFEEILNKKLFPTYAYARLYVPGEELHNHTDRPSCEISATITLGFDGDVWSIFTGNADKSIANKIDMTVGGAMIYKGCEIHHWREKYIEGKWQAQVFLHYVDANGPYAEWKYDKRSDLAFSYESQEKLFYAYPNIFSAGTCDAMVKSYLSEHLPSEQAPVGLGAGQLDTTIRNVKRVMLDPSRDLGARLAAAGYEANFKTWKFELTHANQGEFLNYPVGGRYKSHIDTVISPKGECRKLTVLGFLNDNFKGGKFFIKVGEEKIYPPQEKGTILVFPSFLIHGVEDVEEGVRYSAVCWLVGAFFK